VIKIELAEREKRLLEIGYLGNLSNRTLRKNRFTLKQLVEDTTTSEADLITWRNTLGLEKVKNRYDSSYKTYKLKCKYIASPDFPMADELFIRESLLIIGTKDESKYAMSIPLYKMKRDLIKKSKGI